jgi:hypothetical protein
MDRENDFGPRPGENLSVVKVYLERDKDGWEVLAISAGTNEVKVYISDVYPPFRDMLDWVQMVSRGDIPAEFNIDEEGSDKRLCVLGTADPDRIWFQVLDPNDDMKACVEGVVSRRQLIEAFEDELELARLVEDRSGSWEEEPDTGGTEAP